MLITQTKSAISAQFQEIYPRFYLAEQTKKRIFAPIMKQILYLHGLGSAASTGTAKHLREMLYADDIRVSCYDLPVSPIAAMGFVQQTVATEHPDLVIGTSLGACYAEQLHGQLRILVNPSFHTAKLLTFRGFGKRYPFLNKREDGAKDYMVDKALIAEFREMEKASLKGITPADKALVWGLFGDKDTNVNCQNDFRKAYGDAQFRIFDGEHYLNDRVLATTVVPLIRQLLL